MINIQPIKALKDNYIWLISHKNVKEAWIVDPGEAEPVLKTLAEQGLHLTKILITHHHWDHTAGTLALLKLWPDCEVYASHLCPHDFITKRLREGDTISGSHFNLTVLEIPGHTLDHIAYFNKDLVFTGDTLFSAGCGRIFEGTPQQMFHSLEKLQQLPDETKVYCGHEYTLNNLKFAMQVDSKNLDIKNYIEKVKGLATQNKCSLPSTLSLEKKVNPFLRCEQVAIINAVEDHSNKKLNDTLETFAELRYWKNQA